MISFLNFLNVSLVQKRFFPFVIAFLILEANYLCKENLFNVVDIEFYYFTSTISIITTLFFLLFLTIFLFIQTPRMLIIGVKNKLMIKSYLINALNMSLLMFVLSLIMICVYDKIELLYINIFYCYCLYYFLTIIRFIYIFKFLANDNRIEIENILKNK